MKLTLTLTVLLLLLAACQYDGPPATIIIGGGGTHVPGSVGTATITKDVIIVPGS